KSKLNSEIHECESLETRFGYQNSTRKSTNASHSRLHSEIKTQLGNPRMRVTRDSIRKAKLHSEIHECKSLETRLGYQNSTPKSTNASHSRLELDTKTQLGNPRMRVTQGSSRIPKLNSEIHECESLETPFGKQSSRKST